MAQSIEEIANEWVEAQGFTKGTIRASARKAFLFAFDLGGHDGWMRCGVFHVDIDFETRMEEREEANRRWPRAAGVRPLV